MSSDASEQGDAPSIEDQLKFIRLSCLQQRQYLQTTEKTTQLLHSVATNYDTYGHDVASQTVQVAATWGVELHKRWFDTWRQEDIALTLWSLGHICHRLQHPAGPPSPSSLPSCSPSPQPPQPPLPTNQLPPQPPHPPSGIQQPTPYTPESAPLVPDINTAQSAPQQPEQSPAPHSTHLAPFPSPSPSTSTPLNPRTPAHPVPRDVQLFASRLAKLMLQHINSGRLIWDKERNHRITLALDGLWNLCSAGACPVKEYRALLDLALVQVLWQLRHPQNDRSVLVQLPELVGAVCLQLGSARLPPRQEMQQQVHRQEAEQQGQQHEGQTDEQGQGQQQQQQDDEEKQQDDDGQESVRGEQSMLEQNVRKGGVGEEALRGVLSGDGVGAEGTEAGAVIERQGAVELTSDERLNAYLVKKRDETAQQLQDGIRKLVDRQLQEAQTGDCLSEAATALLVMAAARKLCPCRQDVLQSLSQAVTHQLASWLEQGRRATQAEATHLQQILDSFLRLDYFPGQLLLVATTAHLQQHLGTMSPTSLSTTMALLAAYEFPPGASFAAAAAARARQLSADLDAVQLARLCASLAALGYTPDRDLLEQMVVGMQLRGSKASGDGGWGGVESRGSAGGQACWRAETLQAALYALERTGDQQFAEEAAAIRLRLGH